MENVNFRNNLVKEYEFKHHYLSLIIYFVHFICNFKEVTKHNFGWISLIYQH